VLGDVDERIDRAREPLLAGDRDHRGVVVILTVGDQRPTALDAGQVERAFVEARVHDRVALVAQPPSTRLVALQDHRVDRLPPHVAYQRRHGRAPAVDQHEVTQVGQDLRQSLLEPTLEPRDQHDRNDRVGDHDPKELDRRHVHDHQRALPVRVVAVAGRRQGLRRPAERRPKVALLALEVVHAEPVAGRRDEQGHDQQREHQEHSVEGAAHRPPLVPDSAGAPNKALRRAANSRLLRLHPHQRGPAAAASDHDREADERGEDQPKVLPDPELKRRHRTDQRPDRRNHE
jgi:hypothetical protein